MNAAASVSAALNSGSPERFPRWANTCLVAAIGVALAFVTMKALPAYLPVTDDAPGIQTSSISSPSGTKSNSGPNVRQLANAISGRHMFGDFLAPVEKAVEPEKPKDVAVTRLNLKLAGVFAYIPIERSMAIMSVDNGDQEAFQIGSRIVGETTLEEVHRDHVIIKNRGKFEKVSMADDIKPLPASQIQRAQPQARASNGGAGVDPNAPIELPSTNPGEIRDYLARNPALLGRIVAAEPYQENGKLIGYKITPKQNPEILEAQGIVAGDVITRVNNIQINSQKQGIRALRNVVKAEQLEVMVLRDGVEVPLSISLTQ